MDPFLNTILSYNSVFCVRRIAQLGVNIHSNLLKDFSEPPHDGIAAVRKQIPRQKKRGQMWEMHSWRRDFLRVSISLPYDEQPIQQQYI